MTLVLGIIALVVGFIILYAAVSNAGDIEEKERDRDDFPDDFEVMGIGFMLGDDFKD